MPQTCKACSSPKRGEIDRALLAGEPIRRIAARCAASETALRRHAPHVAETVALAVKAEEVTRADDLLSILHECANDARRIRDKSEADGDLRCSIAAVRTLGDTVEKLVKVAERLAEKEADLAASAEWRGLRERIGCALSPYPEAARAVMEALAAAEEGAA